LAADHEFETESSSSSSTDGTECAWRRSPSKTCASGSYVCVDESDDDEKRESSLRNLMRCEWS